MFCTTCGTQAASGAVFCTQCGKPMNAMAGATLQQYGEVPEGVKGWSWGAFLLSWIWAIGNRTWIGLLALIPYVGFIVAIWLGIQGREMAWKNGKWDSLEHFNRTQRTWSTVALVLYLGIFGLGILAAIAIPAYQSYVKRAHEAAIHSARHEVPAAPRLAPDTALIAAR